MEHTKGLWVALKQRLSDNKGNYINHWSMMGNTEGGFYSTDEFDFDNLLKEIDDFSAEFKEADEIARLRSQLAAAQEELAKLREDAERYRVKLYEVTLNELEKFLKG